MESQVELGVLRQELFLRFESVGAGARDPCDKVNLKMCHAFHLWNSFPSTNIANIDPRASRICTNRYVDTLILTVLATVRSPLRIVLLASALASGSGT
jgi:hypothetical protein